MRPLTCRPFLPLLGALTTWLPACSSSFDPSSEAESVQVSHEELRDGAPVASDAGSSARPPLILAETRLYTTVGAPTKLDGSVSSVDDVIVRVEWDFESDGSVDWSSERDARSEHVYRKVGTYKATLHGSDRSGRSSSAVVEVVVLPRGMTSPVVPPRGLAAASAPAAAASVPGDGTVERYAVLINGGEEVRFWEDVAFAYATLTERLGYTASQVFVLNYAGLSPYGTNPSGMIDGPATPAQLSQTFATLAQLSDGDDELLVWVTDHGNGYFGPVGVAAYPNQPQIRFGYAGSAPEVQPSDERDYLESDFKLRALHTRHISDASKRTIGLNQWAVAKDSWAEGYWREKYVSHFENLLFTSTGTTESNSDVYIEKLSDYLQGDTNRDGLIDTGAGERLDFDNDGNPPFDPATGAFDEGDWGPVESYEPFNYLNTLIPAEAVSQSTWENQYMLFDEGLDGQLDVDFAFTAALQADGTDLDNDGVFDRVDVNLDGDFTDWVSVDETFQIYQANVTDDEFAALLSPLSYGKLVVVLEPCFSGGFVAELSGPNRSISAAAIEEYFSWGNTFIRGFMAAAGGQTEWGSPVDADTDADQMTSVVEAFNYAVANGNGLDINVYDDNGDGAYNVGPIPNGGDGDLGSNICIGEAEVEDPGTITDLGPAQNGSSRTINGEETFRLTSGSSGVVQLTHSWGADVRWSINGSALQPTPQGWGGQISVPPSSVILLKLATTGAQSVGIGWW